jgi:hypothetical protein
MRRINWKQEEELCDHMMSSSSHVLSHQNRKPLPKQYKQVPVSPPLLSTLRRILYEEGFPFRHQKAFRKEEIEIHQNLNSTCGPPAFITMPARTVHSCAAGFPVFGSEANRARTARETSSACGDGRACARTLCCRCCCGCAIWVLSCGPLPSSTWGYYYSRAGGAGKRSK